MQITKEEVSSRFEAAQVAYQKKIRTIAHWNFQKGPGFARQDLEQELLVVLWRCVQNYDPNIGASFNTLFTGSARNRIVSLIRHATTQKRVAVLTSLEEEGIQLAIDRVLNEPSAEDTALLHMRIKGMQAKGGSKIRGDKPSRTGRGAGSRHRASTRSKVSKAS